MRNRSRRSYLIAPCPDPLVVTATITIFNSGIWVVNGPPRICQNSDSVGRQVDVVCRAMNGERERGQARLLEDRLFLFGNKRACPSFPRWARLRGPFPSPLGCFGWTLKASHTVAQGCRDSGYPGMPAASRAQTRRGCVEGGRNPYGVSSVTRATPLGLNTLRTACPG